MVQFTVVWAFEAYLIALVTNTVFMLYCTLAIAALVTERMNTASDPALPLEDRSGESSYGHAADLTGIGLRSQL